MKEVLRITGKNFEVDTSIEEYIEKKLTKIEKYTKNITSLQIILQKTKYIYNTEILSHMSNGKIVKIIMEDKDLFACIEKGIDKLKDMLLKYKEKNVDKKREKKGKKEYNLEDLSFSFEKKLIDIKQMSEKEAVEEFLKNKNDIFIFFNKDTKKISLIRNLGDKFEIIEPRFSS